MRDSATRINLSILHKPYLLRTFILFILFCRRNAGKENKPFEQFKDCYLSSLLTKGTNLNYNTMKRFEKSNISSLLCYKLLLVGRKYKDYNINEWINLKHQYFVYQSYGKLI